MGAPGLVVGSLGGEGNEMSDGGVALQFLIHRGPVVEEEGNTGAGVLEVMGKK